MYIRLTTKIKRTSFTYSCRDLDKGVRGNQEGEEKG